ncbi:MAG: class I adenylate-forming enzyme family protein, partial [Acidimicrobiales bacterium]
MASSRYLRPGGAWDVPTIDTLATSQPVRAGVPAVADSGIRLGADELEGLVAGLAGGLRVAGVRRRDSVGWQLANGVEAYLLYRACWRLGAVAVPVHHQIGATEAAKLAERVEPVVMLSRPGLSLADHPGVRTAQTGHPDWDALCAGPPVTVGAARPADLAVVLFTSGSTGEPKAVLHTHRALVHKALTMVGVHGLHAGDAVLMPAPLAHISGLLNGIVTPAAARMPTVLMERWDPERGLQLVERERISFMIGPPTLFVSMTDHPAFAPGRVASMRIISSGAMSITPEFVDGARAAYGATVKRTYGSTEAPTVTTTWVSDPPERGRDTDGRAVGEVELRTADPRSGRACPAGTTGELWLRGPELFAGYADVDQTRSAMRNGWFRTGDLAVMDTGGWVTIVGRLKELIIRAGENIAPAEVERTLGRHPRVSQAVAIGYPDARYGERVAAFVVADGSFDVDECRRWFASQGVARFKTPERVVVVEAIPQI